MPSVMLDGVLVEVGAGDPRLPVPAPPPTPEQIRAAMPPVTRMQFAIALARFGVISGAEAKAFGPGNALPSVAVAAIQNSPLSEADKLEAEIKALSAETIRRTNPLITMMQAATVLTDEQADNLFATAAEID